MFKKLFRRKAEKTTREIAHADGLTRIRVYAVDGFHTVENLHNVHDSGDCLIFCGQSSVIVSKANFIKAVVMND